MERILEEGLWFSSTVLLCLFVVVVVPAVSLKGYVVLDLGSEVF